MIIFSLAAHDEELRPQQTRPSQGCLIVLTKGDAFRSTHQALPPGEAYLVVWLIVINHAD